METSSYSPEKIIIRHLTGSKAGQTEELSLAGKREFQFGRSAQADLSYDAAMDDVVSRQHARIAQDAEDPSKFLITDAGSRNGTFVNGMKISESSALQVGDRVSFGKDGPSFEFGLYPAPPPGVGKATTVIPTLEEEPGATRVYTNMGTNQPAAQTESTRTVGKDTVERMVYQAQTKQRNSFLYILGTVVVLAVAAGVFFLTRDGKAAEPILTNNNKTAAQIFEENKDKVVFVEYAWKLNNAQTGQEVYHVYEEIGGEYRAVYVQLNNGRLEPFLRSIENAGKGAKPIAGSGSATGFIIEEDGFILTNRHVGQAWREAYSFPAEAYRGIVYPIDDLKNPKLMNLTYDMLANWKPIEAVIYGNKWNKIDTESLEGENTRFNVTFADDDQRTPATLARISENYDLAMIKIELPEALPKVNFYDNSASIKVGDEVTALGFPGTIELNAKTKVPSPTFNRGMITKLENIKGDMYQLDINLGFGNSGGPLFNEVGQVIGVITSATFGSDIKVLYAIPIEHGIKLMGK